MLSRIVPRLAPTLRPHARGLSAAVISGTEISKDIRTEVADQARVMKERHGEVPGLAVVLVGQRPAAPAARRPVPAELATGGGRILWPPPSDHVHRVS